MTGIGEIENHLAFVQAAVVARDDQCTGPRWTLLYWAAYTLIGYTLIDMHRQWSGPFFAIGAVIGMVISAIEGRCLAKKSGIYDRAAQRRAMMHWIGGFLVCYFAAIGLAIVNPPLRGIVGSQVFVVMIGLLWYFAGVHGMTSNRHLIWAGPLLMLGGICVGLVPRYGWTGLGMLISICIALPLLGARGRTHV